MYQQHAKNVSHFEVKDLSYFARIYFKKFLIVFESIEHCAVSRRLKLRNEIGVYLKPFNKEFQFISFFLRSEFNGFFCC